LKKLKEKKDAGEDIAKELEAVKAEAEKEPELKKVEDGEPELKRVEDEETELKRVEKDGSDDGKDDGKGNEEPELKKVVKEGTVDSKDDGKGNEEPEHKKVEDGEDGEDKVIPNFSDFKFTPNTDGTEAVLDLMNGNKAPSMEVKTLDDLKAKGVEALREAIKAAND
jgi:hypothetical protein